MAAKYYIINFYFIVSKIGWDYNADISVQYTDNYIIKYDIALTQI